MHRGGVAVPGALCLLKIRKDLNRHELYFFPNSLLRCSLPCSHYSLPCVRSLVRALDLQLEILALRHQIAVLQRSAKKRPRLTPTDRLLWVSLSRIWRRWRSTLVLVKPETVVAWHRKGFRLFWTWKVRHGRPG